MSQPSVIWWPPCVGNEASIAALQDVAQDGNVILNSGAPGTPETPETFTYNKMIRSIIIHSPDNLVGVTFRISGIGTPVNPPPPGGDGNPTQILSLITEDIAGANPTDAESVNIYSQITSIQVIGAPATNVTVGFGTFGITDYVFFDYNRTAAALSAISLQFIDNTTMTAAVYMSLNKPESPNIAQGGVLEPFGLETLPTVTFIPAFSLIGPGTNTNAATQATFAFSVVWATVLGTTVDSLYFTFIQPGIR